MKDHPEHDAKKPPAFRLTQPPGGRSRRARSLAAILAWPSKAKVTLPVVKFLSDDQ